MKLADQAFMTRMDAEFEARRQAILNSSDCIHITGTTYYVSNDGCDENSGTSPECAWQTLAHVSSAKLSRGDAVLFRRGDIFRGSVRAQSGVTYAAYGTGEKPRFYGWDWNLSNADLWELWNI